MNKTKPDTPEVNVPNVPDKSNERIYADKGTHYKNDTQRVYDYFFNHVDTRLGCFLSTGVLEKSICRYVDDFFKDGRAQVVYLGRSPQSGIRDVQFISCNPAMF